MSNRRAGIPMIRPNPPRLSEHLSALVAIEDSRQFSNFGPMVQQFEQKLTQAHFRTGGCVSVCNATLGLMLAIRQQLMHRPAVGRRFAIMPSFTFAATAHAALWNGLVPLFCDIDPKTWLPSADAERALLAQYGEEVAVVVPYATFGNNLDLAHYERLQAEFGVGVVVDAAASLGSLDAQGRAFGDGSHLPVVFSLHATKPFSAGEGGVIYSADEATRDEIRAMSGFGFGQPRIATLPGLNAKMSEVAALAANLRLEGFEAVVRHREALSVAYARHLPEWGRQQMKGRRQCHTNQAVLLPRQLTGRRAELMQTLQAHDIGVATYFSPHLAEHPYFAANSVCGPLDITRSISSRVLTLPMYDEMCLDEVAFVAETLRNAAVRLAAPSFAATPVPRQRQPQMPLLLNTAPVARAFTAEKGAPA